MTGVPFSAVILVIACMAVVGPAFAFPQSYTVEPAFGAAGVAAQDVVPVTFFDLTFREMLIIAALAITPAFVFPVELFFMLKIFGCFGFRRIARSNILASTIRNALYDLIRSRPGISFIELLHETGVSRGALTYHLALMRIAGKIALCKEHGITGYFENSGRYDRHEQKVLKYLRQDTDCRILVTLAKDPLMSRRDFERILGVSGPTVSWHMKRLIDDGILSIRRDGRFSRYILSDPTLCCLKKYHPAAMGAEDTLRAAVPQGTCLAVAGTSEP